MTYRITMVLDLFKGPQDRELSHRTLQLMLDCLYATDIEWLKAHPETPGIYDENVVTHKKLMHYEMEEAGHEDWQDIPTCLSLGTADCLPLDTLVLMEDLSFSALGDLKPGDVIMGDGKMTKVLEFQCTGMKDILVFDLDNGRTLRCSPEHRLFLRDDTEVRAKDIKVDDHLKSPESSAKVRGIRASEQEMCGDITTDTGRFYLPESDVIVHNCEDLACWRAAELTVRGGVKATPTFRFKPRANGSMLYHIVVLLPDGSIEDPSKKLGMGRGQGA